MVRVDAIVTTATTKRGGHQASPGAVGWGGRGGEHARGWKEKVHRRRMDGGTEGRRMAGAIGLRVGMVGMWGVSGHCDGCERAEGREDT